MFSFQLTMNTVFEIIVGWLFVFDNLLDVSWLDELLHNWLIGLDQSGLIIVMLGSGSSDSEESKESDELECHFIGVEVKLLLERFKTECALNCKLPPFYTRKLQSNVATL